MCQEDKERLKIEITNLKAHQSEILAKVDKLGPRSGYKSTFTRELVLITQQITYLERQLK